MENEIITREETAMQAQRLAMIENRIADNMNRLAESMLDIGRCLNLAKNENLVPHGQWQEWVKQHTGLSLRVAQRVMQAAREIPATSALSQLSFSKVRALLSVPASEREEFAKDVDAENKSLRELEAAIKARQAAEREAEAAQKKNEELEKRLGERDEKAANEKDRLLREIDRLHDQLENGQSSEAARAEIDRLTQELAEQEEEIERRAASEADAKGKLLALQSQIARGEISGGDGDGFGPERLEEATSEFMRRASMFPCMRSHIASCDYRTRQAYRETVQTVREWCERAMQALDTVIGEVVEP